MGFRKLLVLLVILLLLCVSCKRKPSEPCIIDCYVESDSVVICLNNQYKVGYIFAGGVGELEFCEGLSEDYEIIIDKDVTKVIIKNDGIIFKDGSDYRIWVESYTGSAKTWSTFNNNKFVPIGYEEAYFGSK
ncbi:MAG: hypothetical protein IKX23_04880 [Treponema sp.]|nr:hypothetical protein [Treponema sp.]